MKKFNTGIIVCLTAILVTTTMDFTGLTMFSALPLILISGIAWIVYKMPRAKVGLIWGPVSGYGLALLYPLVVLGFTATIAFLFSGFHPRSDDSGIIVRNIVLACTVGSIMALLTEEFFFRGWLWGYFRTKERTGIQTLWASSIIFTIWHISAVTSGTSYGLPLYQVPIYLTNAFLLGMIWGIMRLRTGSVLVPAISHAVWNAFAYELFGFGEKVGYLGIENTIIWGPEVGLLGIVLNGLFCLWLWRNTRSVRPDVFSA